MKKWILAVTAMLMAAAVSGCAGTGKAQSAENPAAVQAEDASEQTDLVILVQEITERASFYPITVDGTDMEVFAVRDSSGNIRTAFNTCQSCYTSGNGRYALEGTDLVCQNCGFHFTADQVGANPNGGCSPWAISAEERTDTDDTITISYDYLASSKNIFANWK